MTPRYILAVTDFSVHGDNALNRAALLSAEHGAQLTLAYWASAGEKTPPDAATRLIHHALQLSERHGIQARAASQLAYSVENLQPLISAADLVVWGTAPVRSLRSFFFGQPVEELSRKTRRPVLVAHRSAKYPYRSVLAAVDFSDASRALVDLSVSLSESASVDLFHATGTAYEGKLRYAQVSDRVIKDYREHCRRHAQARMLSFSDTYASRRNRVESVVAHGDAARQTVRQQQRSDSELIIVGKRPSSTFMDLMFGSVASRVLRYLATVAAHADVLIVPHDWEPASRPVSAVRVTADQAAARRVRAGAPVAPPGPNQAAVYARA